VAPPSCLPDVGIEQTKALEAEKEAAVEQVKQEAATLETRRRRQYLAVIAILVLLLLGLIAYVLI
jgi:hypothetical protein